MRDTRSFLSVPLYALIAALALLPATGAAETVGSAAAVKPSSTGTPPGGSTRTLEVGTNIVERERIQTSQAGSLQVMFLDKTTLTVGPNSDLLIDEFVYNANAGTGQFAASLTKGALRFVGGQISHKAGVTINTPTATVGIRGGAARIDHGQLCSGGDCTQVLCSGGNCTVKSRIDAKQVVLQVNQLVQVGALGISPPVTITTANVNDLSTAATTGDEQGGGGGGQSASFSSQSQINQAVQEQDKEPEAPAPTAPPPGGPTAPLP